MKNHFARAGVLIVFSWGAWAAAQDAPAGQDKKTPEQEKSSEAEASSSTEKKSKKSKKVYRETPFGPALVDPDQKRQRPEKPERFGPFVRFEKKGDLYIFRRETPFGDQVWKRKSSELTPLEQELIERTRKEQAGEEAAPVEGKNREQNSVEGAAAAAK